MKLGKWAILSCVAIVLLVGFVTGCANFWQPPSTTTTCTSKCTTASSADFYVLNGGTTPEVVGESINTGTLTAIAGSPWTLQGTPYAMSISPTSSFLMVSTTSGVFTYPLTNNQLGTGTQVSTDQAYAIAVDTTGSWLIEAIPGTNSVTIGAVPINSSTGAGNGTEQTATYNITNASVQNKMVISGDDNYILVPLGAGGTIIVPLNANVSAGSNPLGSKATVIPVANTSGSALSVGVDPGSSPRLLYVGETLAGTSGTTGGLRVFNYSSLGSTLTQATGSPLASGGLAPNAILPEASGDYVYVANGQGTASAGNVTGFTITSSGTTTITYTVALDTTTAAGVQPASLAEDSTSTFVIAVGAGGSPYFDAYTFDATTLGQLDSELSSSTAVTSIAVVAAP